LPSVLYTACMGRPEYLPKREIDLKLADAYATTFIPRRDCYPWQQPDGRFITIYEPLTTPTIAAHLLGQLTLGAYALDSTNMAHWLCFDADDEAQWQGLLILAEALEAQNITGYRESSRRGGHLWLFTPPLPGIFARRIAAQLLTEHQLDVEVYPKQGELTSGVGSFVRLPLGIHRKSGRVYPFIDHNGQPLAPTFREQLALLAQPVRLPLPFVLAVLARIPPTRSPQPKPSPAFRTVEPTAQMLLSERLKGTISVLEFVSRYVPLDAHNLGFCPFHDDQHKSFGVHVESNYWHCFAGCGGGSIIDFWMKWREHNGQDGSFTATITELRKLLL
jgi:hypothetical protein